MDINSISYIRPHFGDVETAEPSLRWIVEDYYRRNGMDHSKLLSDRYFSVLDDKVNS